MYRSVIATAFVFLLAISSNVLVSETAEADDFQSLWRTSCMIRKDKFDYVLPGAMRRNGIDMWIVFDHGRGSEPMMLDFGIETAYGQGIYVFFDEGGDRIERISLGGESELAQACGAYDMYGRSRDLRSIVEERDPQQIGLNFAANPHEGEGIRLADGLSHTDYEYLEQELGEKYSSRFVSAQHLIADFHGERVAAELIEFSKIADITWRELERALSNEVITPGKTTHNDVARWLEERRETMGLHRTWFPTVYTHLPNGGEIGGTERVIQRGDILQIDWGLNRNNFATDMKRFAYVLKEGETEVPPGILNAFAEAKKVREIIRKNVRSGQTGRVQIDALKQIIEDAGYVYTERERASDGPGVEVNVGMHAAGNISHDVSAGLFEIYPERTKYEVRPNLILAFEYIVFTPADEWGGVKIPVNIEENVVVTERGIEWLHAPQEQVLIIR